MPAAPRLPPFTPPPGRTVRDLPDLPRVAHDWASWPSREVNVTRPDGLGAVRVHCKVLGEGPPLLLVHGLMTSSYSFRYVGRALSARYRVVVPDLPGAGRSEAPGDLSCAPSAVADLLAALIRELGQGAPYVVGNSLGGYYSLWLAARHPGLLQRLLVMHAPGVPLARLYALAAAVRVPGARRAAAWVMRRDPAAFALRNVHYRDESLKSREEAEEYGSIFRSEARTAFFLRILAESLRPSAMRALHRLLPGVAAPTTLLYADSDPMVPPAVGPALFRHMPQARFVWMRETSHFMHVDTPEAAVEEILRAG